MNLDIIDSEIFSFFADRNFERSRRFGAGAYNPEILKNFLKQIGNPQFEYETIHVAGTVGKGSATTYLSRALTTMGFKTCAYLSPHFVSLTERFTIGGVQMPVEILCSLWAELKTYQQIETLSFFDAMTALAFLYFARERCDWAVIETGLGGRLDSTNNLKARIAVITLIDLDHQNILGNSLEAIAREKAGIIQKGQDVYTVEQPKAAAEILSQTCTAQNAVLNILITKSEDYLDRNREFALGLVDHAFKPDTSTRKAIEKEIAKPVFGRLSLLRKAPRLFFDGGHNAASMRALCSFVDAQSEPVCNIFMNTMTERDLEQMAGILQSGIRKVLNLYFFPMSDKTYYAEPPAAARLKVVTDMEIRRLAGVPDQLNLFTGSMGIYKELKARFLL